MSDHRRAVAQPVNAVQCDSKRLLAEELIEYRTACGIDHRFSSRTNTHAESVCFE